MRVIIRDWKDRLGWRALPCGCDMAELVMVITANRSKQFRLRCMGEHRGKIHTQNLPYQKLTEREKSDCEIVRINRPTDDGVCERCGLEGLVQGHHIAPHQYFRDANDWPLMDLCQSCHTEWHQKIEGKEPIRANIKAAS